MLIGIDAGGTSTRAVVLDRDGNCRGYGTAGGGNPVSRGADQAAHAIVDAVTRAIAGVDAVTSAIAGADDRAGAIRSASERGGRRQSGIAVLAMAGGNSVPLPDAVAARLREVADVEHVEIASDLLAMFCSGTSAPSGYGLVSGTGAAAVRVEGGAVVASADGLGWLLGDVGSGFWIGRRVVRAAAAALDGYGPDTALAPMVARRLGVGLPGERRPDGRPIAVQELVGRLYRMAPVEVSQFAELAFRAAGVPAPDSVAESASDPIAAGILVEARARLLDTVGAVRSAEVAGPIVMGGSIAARLPGLKDAVAGLFASVGDAVPALPSVVEVPDGVAGAAVLTLRRAGITVDGEVFARITATLAALRDE